MCATHNTTPLPLCVGRRSRSTQTSSSSRKYCNLSICCTFISLFASERSQHKLATSIHFAPFEPVDRVTLVASVACALLLKQHLCVIYSKLLHITYRHQHQQAKPSRPHKQHLLGWWTKHKQNENTTTTSDSRPTECNITFIGH